MRHNLLHHNIGVPKQTPLSSIIKINCRGDAYASPFDVVSNMPNPKLTGLSRLQNKRQMQQTDKRIRSVQKYSTNMMTMSDKIYASGDSSDVAYMPRHIGILSHADHFGRLR